MGSNELPLRPLHLPDPIGWLPLAPGWWFVIALLTMFICWFLFRAWRRYQFFAPQRHAMRTLAKIESDYLTNQDPLMLGRELSELLRRAMLAYAPRHELAGLTGDAWLDWLDRGLPVPYFHTEGGKSLLQLPYRNPNENFDDVDVNALLAAIRMRLSTPVGSTV
jgi:hypothetical protein